MRSLLEMISKERKGVPPTSKRKDREGGGGEQEGKVKAESRTVSVQTDFPAQLLESYVVKHKARWIPHKQCHMFIGWTLELVTTQIGGGSFTQNDNNAPQGPLPLGVPTNQQHKSQPVPASSTDHPGHPSGSFLIIIILNHIWSTIKSQNTNYKILTGWWATWSRREEIQLRRLGWTGLVLTRIKKCYYRILQMLAHPKKYLFSVVCLV